jgi:uncharacterized protein YutE (UPF0331/DUF86 family)
MIGRSDDTVNQLGHVINKNEDSIESLVRLNNALVQGWADTELTLETKIESLENKIEGLVNTLQTVTSMLTDNKKKGWFNK